MPPSPANGIVSYGQCGTANPLPWWMAGQGTGVQRSTGVRGNQYRRPISVGHRIVIGTRIGAAVGLLAAIIVSLLALALAAEPTAQLRSIDPSDLIVGVAAGAALGATFVALRMRARVRSASGRDSPVGHRGTPSAGNRSR